MKTGASGQRRRPKQAYEFGEGFKGLEETNRQFRILAALFALVLAGVLTLLVMQLRG